MPLKKIHDTPLIIGSLREKIHRLSEEQIQALKRTAFIRMTSDEAIECDSRRCLIRSLVGKLERLQGKLERLPDIEKHRKRLQVNPRHSE